jgi:hypothetical protein
MMMFLLLAILVWITFPDLVSACRTAQRTAEAPRRTSSKLASSRTTKPGRERGQSVVRLGGEFAKLLSQIISQLSSQSKRVKWSTSVR